MTTHRNVKHIELPHSFIGVFKLWIKRWAALRCIFIQQVYQDLNRAESSLTGHVRRHDLIKSFSHLFSYNVKLNRNTHPHIGLQQEFPDRSGMVAMNLICVIRSEPVGLTYTEAHSSALTMGWW